MKKLLYSILALVGVVATSCTQDHIDVVYNPGEVTPATIVSVQAGDIASGAATTVNYTTVNYNMQVSNPLYTLYIAKADTEMADKKKLSADFAKAEKQEDGSLTVSIDAKTINQLLIKAFKAAYDVPFDVEFQIETAVSNEKGTAVNGTQVYSNTVKATYTPVEIKEALPDKDEFEHVWVIGDYCGWSHDKSQYLYNYTGDENTYSGVVDFGGKAANGFKLTGIAGWDDSCNWGDSAEAAEADEPASLQLINGGGSKNIKHYAKRYYHFTFDKASLTLTKNHGFDGVGIIGVGGNWETDAKAMEFNPTYCRFYADVTFAAGDSFKCRADGGWDLSWGANAVSDNGDNVTVADAGNYRVYLNLNKGTLELNADMYGKAEPGMNAAPEEPEQPEEKVYGLVGTFNSWGGDENNPVDDRVLGEHNGTWVAYAGLELKADDQFKVRVNQKWDESYGAAGDNEPLLVTVGEKLTLVSGGKNLSAPAGTYDVYFDTASLDLYVVEAGAADPTIPADAKPVKVYCDVSAAGWTACKIYTYGDAELTGGWSGTEMVKETLDDKEYFVYEFAAVNYGKTTNIVFNNGLGGDENQTVDIKNIVLNDDYIFALIENGDGGKWTVTINGEKPAEPEAPAVDTWDVCGTFLDNNWATGIALVAENNYFVAQDVQFSGAAGEFKVRKNGSWDNDKCYGVADGTAKALGEAFVVATNDDGGTNNLNYTVEAEVKYDVYFDVASLKVWLMADGEKPAELDVPVVDTWDVCGKFLGNEWSTGIALVAEDNYFVAQDVQFSGAAGEFKVRKNGSWDNDKCYGVADGTAKALGEAFVVATNDDGGTNNLNYTVEAEVKYDVYFDVASLKVWLMADGEKPTL